MECCERNTIEKFSLLRSWRGKRRVTKKYFFIYKKGIIKEGVVHFLKNIPQVLNNDKKNGNLNKCGS